jgi:uncharacterized protein with PIN domain
VDAERCPDCGGRLRPVGAHQRVPRASSTQEWMKRPARQIGAPRWQRLV